MTDTGSEPDDNATPRPASAPAEAQPVTPFGPAPGTGWDATPASSYDWSSAYTPPPAERNRGVAVAVTVCVVLLLACAGVAGGFFLLRSPRTAASGPLSRTPLPPGDSLPASAGPSDNNPSEQQGPRPSAYAAADIEDLNRVCDENVYYPQSPSRAGRAPHPLVLLVTDNPGIRYQDGTYYFSEGLAKTVEESWASTDATKVQTVACLDKVSTGSKIRDCAYDDPKPDTAALVHAGWRLRVYEAATGRILLDKAMDGDDQKCPSVVLVYADKQIYAKVSDRVVVAALRDLVNK